MTAAQAPQAQAASSVAKKPVSASNETPTAASDFASMLAQNGKKTVPTIAKPNTMAAMPGEAQLLKSAGIDPKMLASNQISKKSAANILPDDLSGAPVDPKEAKLVTLTDLLASVSHESKAPEGTEVLNLKTVLAYTNDNPKLINEALVENLPPEERTEAVKTLIKGAKAQIQERLEGFIPKERIPKTLKGMLETALRFEIPVSDIKVETLKPSQMSEKILQAFHTKQELAKLEGMPLPAGKKLASLEGKENSKEAHVKKSDEDSKESQAKDKPTVVSSPLQDALSKATKVASEGVSAQVAAESLKKKSSDVKTDKEISKEEQKELQNSAKTKEAVAQEAVALTQAQKALSKALSQKEPTQSGENIKPAQEEESTQETQQAKTQEETKAERASKPQQPIELKMAEARTMMRELSSNLKEAMENYKPPFTKLSMKLNPERLGEVDVSIIQRGNKVHINLSSNPAALQILQQHSGELKTALNNAGLNDAAMNFNQSSNGGNSQHQQQQSTAQKYAQLAHNQEHIESLELIVAQYG